MKNKSLNKFISSVLSVLLVAALFLTGCSSASAPGESGSSAETTPVATPEPTPEPSPLEKAYAENNDVVGWLTVNGCEIDNRVFQSYNNDTYLRLDESGKYDVWGCYFLDYINVIENGTMTDKVSIIYGHALDDDPNSEEFSKLKKYKDADFAKANPEITFQLLDGETKWQIFSACDIPVTIDYIDPNPDEEKYSATLNHMLTNSYVDFGVEVTAEDKILVLSTCTSNENVRFVVAAKLAE